MSDEDLLGEVLESYGGLERWRALTGIRAHVRSGGLLLSTRAPRGLFSEYRLSMRLDEQRIDFDPLAVPEGASFDRGTVRLTDAAGKTTDERADPRALFFGRSGLRRNFRWDALDTAYFAGYAMWNYLATPVLLTRDEVTVSEGEVWTAPGGETWRSLDVTFPAGFHTHSPQQTFWFGPDHLLRRHDYTAEVIGGWAKAGHLVSDHREFGGLIFPTRRRVKPRGPANRTLPGPTLVWLDLDEIEVESG